MPTTAGLLLPYPSLTAAPNVPGDIQALADALEAKLRFVLAGIGTRNRIINGDFRINQRAYVSAAALGVGVYGFDRWKSMVAASSMTFAAAPAGQLVTINSGGQFAQVIERANMPAGRYVVAHGGTAQARAYNSGAGAPSFAAAPIVVDLDGTADVVVEFLANGATKTLGLVQVEQVSAAGTVADATPFERRSIGVELLLCRRYFVRKGADAGANSSSSIGTGLVTGTTVVSVLVPLSAALRAAPTVTFAGSITLVSGGAGAVGPTTVSAVAGVNWSVNGADSVMLTLTPAVGLTVGYSATVYATAASAGNFMDFSSEL